MDGKTDSADLNQTFMCLFPHLFSLGNKNPHFAFISTARKELNLSEGLLMFLCVQNKYNTTLNHSLSASLVRHAGDGILANSLGVSCCNQIYPDFSCQGRYNRGNKPL